MSRRIAAGAPEPMGVTSVGDGVNVAVFSAHAERIEFCLFDADGARELERIALPERTGGVWHAFIPDITPGARYGLRAHGPYDPARGHRFNPHKLLLDPFATTLDRRFELHPSMFAFANPDGSGFSESDSAPVMPRAIVGGEPAFAAPRRPDIPWRGTILYEMNLRGFSMLNPRVSEHMRGTFAGLAHPASLEHLKGLGVTAIEIMPAMAWLDERHLPPLGLTNAWGYNPVAFRAVDPKLAPGGWAEVAAAVEAIHAAGLEIILDVVLNHSGEGDALGPTVSLRGLDNASYYRLNPDDPARYIDDMGCGNCLALDRPPAVRLCMDSLRLWARAGFDGFRFDLATALGRRPAGFDAAAPLISAIEQDPELRGLKLIAEAWDIGPGGYQVGAFPASFAEWNDRYRDGARRFWRGDSGMAGEMATRLAGSQDLFAAKRRPSRSVNFITAHDGFTLADLVSYETKRNAGNGEDNRDGTNANHSWNHGVDGQTTDETILALRRRDQLNLLATLLFSRGTPMLAMGAETGHSQQGNNNAYAQDNAVGWFDWETADASLFEAARALIEARRAAPLLGDDRFLTGDIVTPEGFADARWLRPDGSTMRESDWAGARETLCLALAGARGDGSAERLLLALHRGAYSASLVLPEPRAGQRWKRLADTALPPSSWGAAELETEAVIAPRSVTLFVEAASPTAARRRTGAPDEAVERLADVAGVYRDWWDHSGANHRVSLETKRALLAGFGFDVTSGSALRDAIADGEALRRSAPAPLPGAGWRPEEAARGYGVAAQLYSLRRQGDQGVGDLTTLALAAEKAGKAGAIAFGINPLHALFPNDRDRASPYHPSDRRFIDPTVIDIADLGWLLGQGGDPPADEVFRAAELSRTLDVDYPGVAALKQQALKRIHADFSKALSAGVAGAAGRDFQAFTVAGGAALKTFATFRAIEAQHRTIGWRDWPEDLSNATGEAVRRFAEAHGETVEFECFQQWLADRQLATAARRAQDSGLTLGLYRDLAVGCAPDGAEIWANREAYASGVSVGAPPDPFSANGQVWNLPPPNPLHMLKTGSALFRELIAANMRHAGMLRIDHVLGLNRLFLVPDGAKAGEGAYVAYPLEHLLGVLAQESRRNRCIVVGEDLGTVPDGFREALAARNVLSYRVLWFERDGDGFKAPEVWPADAVACVSTHDLATLAGWWIGADIEEKLRIGLLAPPAAAEAREARMREKAALLALLAGRGLCEASTGPEAPLTDALAGAIHRLLALTPSAAIFAQADDLAGESVAVNLPGTDRERPNWRRKLAIPVEALFDTPLADAILSALRER